MYCKIAATTAPTHANLNDNDAEVENVERRVCFWSISLEKEKNSLKNVTIQSH